MTSYYNSVQHSSGVSEVSSTSPSPISSSTAVPSIPSPGNVPRYGTVVPNRVFVGGIASNTTETELQELFAQYGNIKEINIISDREGVCKGYGFVTFESEEEAKRVQHEPDTIVLKERRLNIGPAVIKQQPFNRSYDVAPQGGALLYHNGTPYTYQHGMAYFSAASSQSPFSVGGARDSSMYAAPFGPAQTSSGSPAYPPLMYPTYAQPLPYLPGGQQYQYPLPFEYFKTLGPAQSPYMYASHNPMNGTLPSAINGGLSNSSQSPSPSYGQQTGSGPAHPAGPPPAYYHAGSELYYNGSSQHSPMAHNQPPLLYQVEASHTQTEAGTPVVSLLKLHEAGSVEEMEITRTPKKPVPPACPRQRPRPLRPAPPPGRGRGACAPLGPHPRPAPHTHPRPAPAPSPHLLPAPHRPSSLSPPGQVGATYGGGRQPQLQQPQQLLHQQSYGHQRRGGGGGGGLRSRHTMVNSRNNTMYNSSQNYSHSARVSTVHTVAPKSNGSAADSVNGVKASPASPAPKAVDSGGAGDAPDALHSPPSTPLSAGTADQGDSEICKKIQALAV